MDQVLASKSYLLLRVDNPCLPAQEVLGIPRGAIGGILIFRLLALAFEKEGIHLQKDTPSASGDFGGSSVLFTLESQEDVSKALRVVASTFSALPFWNYTAWGYWDPRELIFRTVKASVFCADLAFHFNFDRVRQCEEIAVEALKGFLG